MDSVKPSVAATEFWVSRIMVQLRKRLTSQREFTNWLTRGDMFYFAVRLPDFGAGVTLLPEIQRRLAVSVDVGG
jgi:hypothetical protein